jgi:hypothetical protein
MRVTWRVRLVDYFCRAVRMRPGPRGVSVGDVAATRQKLGGFEAHLGNVRCAYSRELAWTFGNNQQG